MPAVPERPFLLPTALPSAPLLAVPGYYHRKAELIKSLGLASVYIMQYYCIRSLSRMSRNFGLRFVHRDRPRRLHYQRDAAVKAEPGVPHPARSVERELRWQSLDARGRWVRAGPGSSSST